MVETIPAPEIPPNINKGGSQHQLDAMNADSSAPKLANAAPRLAAPSSVVSSFVAHGDSDCWFDQQSPDDVTGRMLSSDISLNPIACSVHGQSTHMTFYQSRSPYDASSVEGACLTGTFVGVCGVTNNRLETMPAHHLDQVRLRDAVSVVRDEQQIQVHFRFHLAFPFVLDGRNCVKL